MNEYPLVELSVVLAPRDESPSIDAVMSGDLPIVAKVRFGDGGIELRATAGSRTDLILVRRGDLLVSGINALKGAIAIHPKNAPTEVAATIHYSAYKINESRALPEFVQEYLRSDAFRRRAIPQLPSGIKTELKSKRLLSVQVPWPSLGEQTTRLVALKSKRAAVRALIERRFGASQMVLGRRVTIGADARYLLLARLRDMQENVAAHCAMGTLQEVLVDALRHGPSFPCAPDADGVPVLMPSATTGFGLDTTKTLFATGSPDLRPLDYLEPGDIIFARGNKPDQVGNCGLYEGEPDCMTYANLFMRIRVDAGRIDPWFAQYWLMTPNVREHVKRHTKGTGPSIQKINGQGVRTIPFPRDVPRKLQRWWLDQLHELRLLTGRLEELQRRQCADAFALQGRITVECFAGL